MKSPGVLIELRRGKAINNIITLVLNGVISIDDLEGFSDELKENVKFMISIK